MLNSPIIKISGISTALFVLCTLNTSTVSITCVWLPLVLASIFSFFKLL